MDNTPFALSSRVLHWLMAIAVLAMLFVGIGMVASLSNYGLLLAIHRPLGIAILVLVVIRFINRQLKPPPPFLDTMSAPERFIAKWSERLLYALMFVLPLVGWGMLSAARYPIALSESLHLPPILPHSVQLYTVLRQAHTVLAFLLFGTFLAHISGVLFHTLVLRDGLIERMLPRAARRGRVVAPSPPLAPSAETRAIGSDAR